MDRFLRLLPLLVCAALVLWWPVVQAHVVAPVAARVRAWADDRAQEFIDEVAAAVAPVVAGRLPDDLPGLAPACVGHWWRRFMSEVLLLAPVCLMLAAVVGNVPGLGTGAGDAAAFAATSLSRLPTWVEGVWHRPPPLSAAMPALALLVLSGCGGWIAFAVKTASSGSSSAQPGRGRGMPGGYFPVLVVLDAAAQCGRAHRRWHDTAGTCEVPRVSLALVERMMWHAPRIRYEIPRLAWLTSAGTRMPAHRRQAMHAHAGQVVAALRACEARQDIHPGSAFQDLAVMLVTIAERYAQGRLTCLLDDGELNRPAAAAPREALRLAVLGAAAVAAVAVASLAGFPSPVLDAVSALVFALGSGWALRRRLPGPSEFLGLLRGGSRS